MTESEEQYVQVLKDQVDRLTRLLHELPLEQIALLRTNTNKETQS